MERLKRLLIHIIREVRDAQGSLTKTKLVKLLYLIDVEAYQEFGRTITGTQWTFFLYGPYAAEIDNALNSLAGHRVEETEFLSSRGRRGYTYQRDEDPRLHEVLSLDERLVVQDVLRRWADEELNQILDFVYFKTPPMAHARFDAPLDFFNDRGRADLWANFSYPCPTGHCRPSTRPVPCHNCRTQGNAITDTDHTIEI